MLKKGDLVSGKIVKIETYGLFLELESKDFAFLPKEAMNIAKNKKLSDIFVEGYLINANVVNKKKEYYTLTQKKDSEIENSFKTNSIKEIVDVKEEIQKSPTLNKLKKMKSIGNFKISVKKDTVKNNSVKKEVYKNEKKLIVEVPENYIDNFVDNYNIEIKKFEELRCRLKERGFLNEN